jgi:hypothetical protein
MRRRKIVFLGCQVGESHQRSGICSQGRMLPRVRPPVPGEASGNGFRNCCLGFHVLDASFCMFGICIRPPRYISVDHQAGRALFYAYAEASLEAPDNAPLLLWWVMNGNLMGVASYSASD